MVFYSITPLHKTRLDDALRLLEVLLFAAEELRHRDVAEQNQSDQESSGFNKRRTSSCVSILNNMDGNSHYARIPKNDIRKSDDSSDALYQKACKIASTSQRWKLSEVFQTNQSVQQSRRLDPDPPLVMMIRPGATGLKEEKQRQRMREQFLTGSTQASVSSSYAQKFTGNDDEKVTPLRHPMIGSKQTCLEFCLPNSDQIQPLSDFVAHRAQTSCIIGSKSTRNDHNDDHHNYDDDGNNGDRKFKDLHVSLKLSNLSALIETLEKTSPSHWIQYCDHSSFNGNISERPSSCVSTSSSDPVVQTRNTSSRVSSIGDRRNRETYSSVSQREFSETEPISPSPTCDPVTALPPTSNVPSDCDQGLIPQVSSHEWNNSFLTYVSSEVPSICHWESLLAACLLCIQLWKLLDSLQPPSGAVDLPLTKPLTHQISSMSFSSKPDALALDSTAPSPDCNDTTEWTTRLDELTWRLELLSQRIIQYLWSQDPHSQLHSDLVHSLMSSSEKFTRKPSDNYTYRDKDVVDIDTTSYDLGYRNSGNKLHRSNKWVSSYHPTSGASVKPAVPLSRFSNQSLMLDLKSRGLINWSVEPVVYTLKSCQSASQTPVLPSSILQSSDATTSVMDSGVPSCNPHWTELQGDVSHGPNHNTNQTCSEGFRKYQNAVQYQSLRDSQRLDHGDDDTSSTDVRNYDPKASLYADDELPCTMNVTSQMYLSKVTLPRLVPIWDDTLEAEVNKTRHDEILRVQQALHDLHELQGTIALRTWENGQALEKTKDQLEGTVDETREATVDLAKANKARSSWWGLKASGVSTVGGVVAGGLILGPVGAVAAGSLAGAAGLIAGNSIRKVHDAKMEKIIRDNRQPSLHNRNEKDKNLLPKAPFSARQSHSRHDETGNSHPLDQFRNLRNERLSHSNSLRISTRMPFL